MRTLAGPMLAGVALPPKGKPFWSQHSGFLFQLSWEMVCTAREHSWAICQLPGAPSRWQGKLIWGGLAAQVVAGSADCAAAGCSLEAPTGRLASSWR